MKKRVIILIMTTLAAAAWSHGETGSEKAHPQHGFAVEPYLLDVTTDAATVAFHLKWSSSAEVLVHDGNKTVRFASDEKGFSHFVRITGLRAARTYRYEVIVADGSARTPEGDPSFQIRTACLPGEAFTFAVYGDPRPGETGTHRHHQTVISQVMLSEPAFSLVLGDMVDEGQVSDHWENFFEVESRLLRHSAIYPVLGDNDHARGQGKHADYLPRLERGYYHFQWGDVHFFAMRAWDARGAQSQGEIDADSQQIRWLENELSRRDVQSAPFRVVFLHDPVYISRGRSAEILRRVWAPIFEKHRVDLVFASWHMYERSHHHGVRYIITGGAGAELIWMNKNPALPSQVDARRHHFVRVDVGGGAMTVRAIADDGTVLDMITLSPRAEAQEEASGIALAAYRLGRELTISEGAELPEIRMVVFSYDCSTCRKLLRHDLPAWAREAHVSARVRHYDLAVRGTYDLLMAAEADFGRQNVDIPAVFVGRAVLGGEHEIRDGLPRELRIFRREPASYRERSIVPFQKRHDTESMREAAFKNLHIGVVIGAGLLDGFNPCAMATVIFLISYLSLVGGDRRQLLMIGGLFTLGVFTAYLTIGILLFQVTRWAFNHWAMEAALNLGILLLVTALAGLSVLDFFRSLKGKPTAIALQLPGFLKTRMRGRIRDYARNKVAISSAAIGLGIVIAAMEFACTGQVYIPIVTMISDPNYRAAAALYLVLYNVAFIVPLVVVFSMAALGVTSARMATFFKRHVAAVKLGLTCLFITMALAIMHNMGWIA
jgi:cytochrome c biogenesis protein CcdA